MAFDGYFLIWREFNLAHSNFFLIWREFNLAVFALRSRNFFEKQLVTGRPNVFKTLASILMHWWSGNIFFPAKIVRKNFLFLWFQEYFKFGGNLIWRSKKDFKFGGNLIWRFHFIFNFGGNKIWRILGKNAKSAKFSFRQNFFP